MAKLSHSVEYFAARATAGVAGLLSAGQADRFALNLGRLCYRLMQRRRLIALDNLRQAFGSRYSEEEYHAIARKVFEGFARTTIETSRSGAKSPDPLIELAGEDVLTATYSEGKGGIIVSPHFGNFELIGTFVASRGYPITFVVATHSNRRFDRYLNDLRRRQGIDIISVPVQTRAVVKHLKQNRFVAIAPDQHAPTSPLIMDFFGRPAAVATGPARFALAVGCPILPFALRRVSYDHHILHSGNVIRPVYEENRDVSVRRITEAYLKFFEQMIREYPDQWLWTHRRWKIPAERNLESAGTYKRGNAHTGQRSV